MATDCALDDQLIEPGLVAVSAPVPDPGTGRVACVASVVSHTSRHTAENLRTTLLPRLRSTVTAMENDLRTAPTTRTGHPPLRPGHLDDRVETRTGPGVPVESLARGLTAPDGVRRRPQRADLTEVAKATGLGPRDSPPGPDHPRTRGPGTADPDHRFTLTPESSPSASPPLSRTSLPQIAQPHLTALADRVHESASLAVLSDSGRGDPVHGRAHRRAAS